MTGHANSPAEPGKFVHLPPTPSRRRRPRLTCNKFVHSPPTYNLRSVGGKRGRPEDYESNDRPPRTPNKKQRVSSSQSPSSARSVNSDGSIVTQDNNTSEPSRKRDTRNEATRKLSYDEDRLGECIKELTRNDFSNYNNEHGIKIVGSLLHLLNHINDTKPELIEAFDQKANNGENQLDEAKKGYDKLKLAVPDDVSGSST